MHHPWNWRNERRRHDASREQEPGFSKATNHGEPEIRRIRFGDNGVVSGRAWDAACMELEFD
jgi:hypothetical protein